MKTLFKIAYVASKIKVFSSLKLIFGVFPGKTIILKSKIVFFVRMEIVIFSNLSKFRIPLYHKEEEHLQGDHSIAFHR